MDSKPATTVLLADHPGIGRTAIAALMADMPGVQLVAKLSHAGEMLSAFRDTQPDVIVVDDRLLRDRTWPDELREARLIVLGMDDDPGFAARARRIGAETWIPKELADSLLPSILVRVEPLAVRPTVCT